MLKIRRPLGRLIFNMGIAIPGKTVFLIETAPRVVSETPTLLNGYQSSMSYVIFMRYLMKLDWSSAELLLDVVSSMGGWYVCLIDVAIMMVTFDALEAPTVTWGWPYAWTTWQNKFTAVDRKSLFCVHSLPCRNKILYLIYINSLIYFQNKTLIVRILQDPQEPDSGVSTIYMFVTRYIMTIDVEWQCTCQPPVFHIPQHEAISANINAPVVLSK